MGRHISSRQLKDIEAYLSDQSAEMVAFLKQLVIAESPTLVPDSQAKVLTLLLEALQVLDYEVELIAGRTSGGQLYARPWNPSAHSRRQLLLGHCDTVWPLGTLKTMPFVVDGNVIKGPGVFDMKGGLTQMLFALKALHALQMKPQLDPIVFINSDEEIGSPESGTKIEQLAQEVARVFVLEPSLGLTGKLKTARKGVGRFDIVVHGRAAHAGLDPEKGVSAILELSYLIQKLYALNALNDGVSVNVGIIEGGLRSNVIAPRSSAVVDVRIPTIEDARRLETAILTLDAHSEGVTLEISGSIDRPPMERTAANRRLWREAQEAAARINVALEEGTAGGGSDGNITSQYTATLDGLGAVGDGAHADHEFIYRDRLVERATLLALLLLSPEATADP